MVQVGYLGAPNLKAGFDELPPFRKKILKMEQFCRPVGLDDLILSAVTMALDTAAYYFTSEPDVFALKPPLAKVARNFGS